MKVNCKFKGMNNQVKQHDLPFVPSYEFKSFLGAIKAKGTPPQTPEKKGEIPQ